MSVTKFMKLLYKAEQATQKHTFDEAPLKNSNQGPQVQTRSRRIVRPVVVSTRKICVPRQHARTNHLMDGLIVTTIIMAITINLSILKAAVVDWDTKEVGD